MTKPNIITVAFALLLLFIFTGCSAKSSDAPPAVATDLPASETPVFGDVGLGDLIPSDKGGSLNDFIVDGAGSADLIDDSKTASITQEPSITPTVPSASEADSEIAVESPDTKTWNPSSDDVVEFKCESFEKIIREMVGKPTRLILYSDVCDITELNVQDSKITDLTGIEYFTNLAVLRCQNNNLTSLDVSKNVKLTQLVCMDNFLTTLDVTSLTHLEWLVCWNNNFPDEEAIIGLDRRNTEFFFIEVDL